MLRENAAKDLLYIELEMIMGMGIDDTIGNGNGEEWESRCMGMGMALIPVGINSHWRMQCLAYVIVTYSFYDIYYLL